MKTFRLQFERGISRKKFNDLIARLGYPSWQLMPVKGESGYICAADVLTGDLESAPWQIREFRPPCDWPTLGQGDLQQTGTRPGARADGNRARTAPTVTRPALPPPGRPRPGGRAGEVWNVGWRALRSPAAGTRFPRPSGPARTLTVRGSPTRTPQYPRSRFPHEADSLRYR